MDRRKFIETLGAAGLMATLGPGGRPARAQSTPAHNLPLFVNALAMGAWDVSLFVDPKTDGQKLYPGNLFQQSDLVQAGAFTLGPTSTGAVQFFQRYASKLLLINGVFAETIDHVTGQQLAMSGSTQQGFPCFSALIAATAGARLGLPFVSGGSYDETARTVAKTLAVPSVVTAMRSVANASASAYSSADIGVITNAVAVRLARKQAIAATPNRRLATGLLNQARQGWSAFPAVLQTLADLQANVPITDGGVVGGPGAETTNNPMLLSIQLGLAGYVNNATISVNLNCGSFDQHTSLYPDHVVQLDSYFIGLDYLMRAAAHLGVADRIFLMGGSDFSRSPHIINPGSNYGKDHWFGTTSVMVLGPGITGNRVIGKTTDGYGNPDDTQALQAMPLDAKTLQPVSTGGVTLTRAYIHSELRRVAGLQQSPLNAQYPLDMATAPLALFE